MKEVVILGGGSGLSAILKGIKEIPGINLSVIVSVADDGGSTKVIRKEFNVPAVGDLRQVIISLSSSEHILKDLMNYRFNSKNNKNSTLHNHSLGNLIILALIKISGSFYNGIQMISDVLKVNGSIYPISNNSNIKLEAEYTDGTKTIGEHKIPNPKKRIKTIRYVNLDKIKTNPIAIEKTKKADYIIFSVGSLYTSIIPNLIAPGIKEAILQNEKATLIYLANIMTQNGETHGMTIYDHVKEIEKYLDYGIIDKVIVHKDKISNKLVEKYKKENSDILLADQDLLNSHVDVIAASLINNNETRFIRHDFKKIKKIFSKIFES